MSTVPKAIRDYMAKLGRKGGSKGGTARTSAMTPAQRTALAKKASTARWGRRP
jgi:hypothetical protein